MYLVALLGNDGDRYMRTRHNVAWILGDHIFGDASWRTDRHKNFLRTSVSFEGASVEVIKPLLMMNNSGQAVASVAASLAIDPDHIIVVHDDVDLPVGALRISYDRGDGNHNGVRSVNKHLHTTAYIRIRVGVGHHGDIPLRSYVLGTFSDSDYALIIDVHDRFSEIISHIVHHGVSSAMNTFNGTSS